MHKSFQFKIQIEGITKPPVWRRVIVPDTLTFEQFHLVIQAAFGWADFHLFQFCPQSYGSYPTIAYPHEEDEYPVEDARTYILKELFHTEKQQFTYIYDLGDSWHHKITLEAIITDFFDDVSCIAGKGTCPPEDCGGVSGYEHLKEVMSNPKDPEHKEMRKWLGLKPKEPWSVDFFDKKKVKNLTFEYPLLSLRMPEFNHPEVKIFYFNSYDIDRDTLHAIMALPRQTLIEDMQKLLIDSVERYEYFLEYEYSEAFFPLHTMYVLSSLRAEEALDTLLFVMSKGEEFLDFWFGDLVTEEFWQYIYWLGQNRTEKLMDFFKTPSNYVFIRSEVLVAITQIAIRQPERKQEIIKWQIEAIEFLYDNINNNAIFESYLFGDLLYDLSVLGDQKILPLIEKCFATGQVLEKETGTLEEVTNNLYKEEIDSNEYRLYNLFTDIDQFYDEWKRWAIKLEEEEEKQYDDWYLNKNQPVMPYIADPKTGRNDPCPCGSGKKYKKCCGVN
jgi:Predicted metal-binding protein related to the C-terminal domain of SecA